MSTLQTGNLFWKGVDMFKLLIKHFLKRPWKPDDINCKSQIAWMGLIQHQESRRVFRKAPTSNWRSQRTNSPLKCHFWDFPLRNHSSWQIDRKTSLRLWGTFLFLTHNMVRLRKQRIFGSKRYLWMETWSMAPEKRRFEFCKSSFGKSSRNHVSDAQRSRSFSWEQKTWIWGFKTNSKIKFNE